MGPLTAFVQFAAAVKRCIQRVRLPWSAARPVPVSLDPVFPKHWFGRALSLVQRREKKRRHLRKIARYARKGKRLPVRGWRLAA